VGTIRVFDYDELHGGLQMTDAGGRDVFAAQEGREGHSVARAFFDVRYPQDRGTSHRAYERRESRSLWLWAFLDPDGFDEETRALRAYVPTDGIAAANRSRQLRSRRGVLRHAAALAKEFRQLCESGQLPKWWGQYRSIPGSYIRARAVEGHAARVRLKKAESRQLSL
jgi:hypothetical protein